jgi:Tfp pilus assembly protein PilX
MAGTRYNMISMSRTRTNEQGMVSILITMIMIIVITLIVLGFSEVTRRNQREALDNQLSTQAYYAAESGVNAAANFLSNYSGAPINTSNCTDFVTNSSSPPPGTPGGLGGTYGSSSGNTNVLNSATRTEYTCLMVNTVPGSLQVKPLSQDASQVWRIEDASGNLFTSFKFTWHQSSTVGATPDICNAGGKNPSYDGAAGTTWQCHYGILRLDLLPIPASGTIPSATLENPEAATTLYLEPSYVSGGNTYSLAAPVTASTCTTVASNCPAQIVHVRCTNSGPTPDCHLTLNLLGATKAEYFARLSMVYEDAADVQLTAQDTVGNAQFKDGQAIIDATGQAQDELRRVQVRIPLVRPTSSLPAFALQSTGSICKQIRAGPAASGVPYTDSCP